MKNERIIEMIDEHLTEPHSLGAEWVEALTICRQALKDVEKKNTEIDILIRKNETLKDEVEKLKQIIKDSHSICEDCKEKYAEEFEDTKSEAIKEFAERLIDIAVGNWEHKVDVGTIQIILNQLTE